MIRLAALLLPLLITAASAQDVSYGETFRLKVDVGGENRKVAVFVPKNIARNEALPLVVALPGGSEVDGFAMRETGQFEQMAYEKRFAVVSVDLTTSKAQGWHPSETDVMERDVEAVLAAIEEAKKKAEELGFALDLSTMALSGHSGACYLALWMGLRHPDKFFVVSLNGFPNWFPEFVKFDGKKATDQILHVYSGDADFPTVKRATEKMLEALKAAGYRAIDVETIKNMRHEPKPSAFVDWYMAKLKKTAKGRKEASKIAEDAKELRELVAAGRSGVYRKIVKLAEREKKAGFGHAAAKLLQESLDESAAALKQAEDLAADNKLFEAEGALKEIESKYAGLPASDTAKELRKKLLKSDEYLAQEMLAKAKEHLDAGRKEKGAEILVKLLEKYPETAAAERAKLLLEG